MQRSLRAIGCAGLFAALAALAPAARPSSTGPQAALTGVPASADVLAEMTCQSCHATSPTNPDALAKIHLEGLPEHWSPGQRYPLVLRVEHPAPDRVRWGFQLTAVDAATLRGAGLLEPGDPELTQVIDGGIADRLYVEHTEPGTQIGRHGGMAWSFAWTAPESGGEVAFFAAVNVSNGDGAKEGDWIYTSSPRPLAIVPGPAASTATP